MSKVYLAGPITGNTYTDCVEWRRKAAKELRAHGITILSPLRFKPWLKEAGGLLDWYDRSALTRGKGITARDRFDVMRSDVVLANVLYATQVSIGTVMEIAWADSRRIPVVLVMEDRDNPHEHAMLSECCAFRTQQLLDGVGLVLRLLQDKDEEGE